MSENADPAWIVANMPKAVEVATALLTRYDGDRQRAQLAATELRSMARDSGDVRALLASRFAGELLASEWNP